MDIDDPLTRRIHIKMSGCPNGCSQHHIANIGFYGASIKVGEHTIPAYIPHIGGSYEGGDVRFGDAAEERACRPSACPRRSSAGYASTSPSASDGEEFNAFVARVGTAAFEERVKDLTMPIEFSLENMNYFIDWTENAAVPGRARRGRVRGLSLTARRLDRDRPDLEQARPPQEVLAYGVEHFHPRLTTGLLLPEGGVGPRRTCSARSTPEAKLFTIDTGVLFPETLATWKRFEERFGLADRGDRRARARARPGPRENCCGAGQGRRRSSARWRTSTPGSPGIRREQAPTRAARRSSSATSGAGIWKLNPLADWTDKDVWRYIFKHDLPYNPLHDQGYDSIGCAPCTLPGERPRRPLGRRGQDRVRDPSVVRRDAVLATMTTQAEPDVTARPKYELSHLETLEAESIHILREVAAEFERPVLLFSGGKDSIVLLRLAEKAFRPGALPVPGHARRHRPQLPRGDRVPRPARRRSSASG